MKCGYVYGLERISQRRNDVKHYYVADGQGSICALTDTAGTITDTYFYTAFGEELAKTGTTENEFRYVGEQWDPNAGFYYLRARWYDQSTGRFASVDPYAGDPQAPVSLHRYLYGNASSVSMSDPSGKVTLMEVCVATYILASLASVAQITIPSLIDQSAVPLKWTGKAYIGTTTLSLPINLKSFGPSGSVIFFDLTSEELKTGVHKGEHRWVLVMAVLTGISFGIPVSETFGDVEVTTPGIWGTNPAVFAGFSTWNSITASFGPWGRSQTEFTLGCGVGSLSWTGGAVKGIDLGVDFQAGISAPVGFLWTLH